MASSGSSLSVQATTLDSFRPDAMEEAVSGGSMDHSQMTKGRFLGRLIRAHLGEGVLDYGAYNLPLLARGSFSEGHVTLGICLASNDTGLVNGSSVDGATPIPIVFCEGAELDYTMAPNSHWMVLQVERDALESAGVFTRPGCSYIPRHDERAAKRLRRCAFGFVAELSRLATMDSPHLDCTLASDMYEELLGVFCRVIDRGSAGSAPKLQRRHLALVRRAMDYLEARIDEPLRIGALCDEVGASWRTLERAFSNSYGLTPKQSLDLCRLNLARQRLLAAYPETNSVGSIAHACGISQGGRFAMDYRQMFGESPSETLKRR